MLEFALGALLGAVLPPVVFMLACMVRGTWDLRE